MSAMAVQASLGERLEKLLKVGLTFGTLSKLPPDQFGGVMTNPIQWGGPFQRRHTPAAHRCRSDCGSANAATGIFAVTVGQEMPTWQLGAM